MEPSLSQNQTRNWVKTIVALAASIYFFWCAADYTKWHFLDNVNLLIHEAGHWIFSPFGQFMYILGGSLNQVLIPLLFFGYFFFYRRQHFEAGLMLFWAGESLLNVTRYVADSLAMQLPLLGGETAIHDWHWILLDLGLLPRTAAIANLFWAVALFMLLAGSYLSVRYAQNETSHSELN